MDKILEVTVPATTANLGAGFDCMGMALHIRNSFIFQLGWRKFSAEGPEAKELEKDRGSLVYTAWETAFAYRKKTSPPLGLHINGVIPVGRGLGSSATAVVAGLYAASSLGELNLTDAELLTLASSIEGHPDNVAPALFGGLVVTSMEDSQIDYVVLPAHEELSVVLAVPDFKLSTSKARSVLPKSVSHKDAVFNTGHAALFVAAWASKKWDIFERSMDDRLHQPYRTPLVPGLQTVMDAAKQAGALGAALSGAGPTVAALAVDDKGDKIGKVMQKAFHARGIKCQIILTQIASSGAVSVA